MSEIYDIAIVGAGVAGLTALSVLSNYKTILLEKENRIGGRVYSKNFNSTHYELGALYGLKTNHKLESNASSPIGLYWKNNLYYGNSFIDILKQLPISTQDKRLIKSFFEIEYATPKLLSPTAYQLLNAFFQSIHPYELNKGRIPLKYEALNRHPTDYSQYSNSHILNEWINLKNNSNIKLQAEVTEVAYFKDRVQLSYVDSEQKLNTILAQKTIIAIPKPEKILPNLTTKISTFLNDLKWVGGGVVVLVFQQNKELPDFDYLVSPDTIFDSVFRQSKSNTVLYYFYITKPIEVNNLILKVYQDFNKIFNTTIPFLLSDYYYWDKISPIINKTYDNQPLDWWQPFPNITLAGDYTYFDSKDAPIPFGTASARESGLRAAELIKKRLNTELPPLSYFIKYNHQNIPQLVDNQQEGNIAWYGLILLSKPDQSTLIKDYLLAKASHNLWEYAEDLGYTAEDTLIVLEGLAHIGTEPSLLVPTLNALAKYFHHQTEPTLYTISPAPKSGFAKGRALYWSNPSIDATALYAYWAYQFKYINTTKAIEYADWLAAHQQSNGLWQGIWFSTPYWTTYYALRLLMLFSQRYFINIHLAIKAIQSAQKPNGSWDHRIIPTVFALQGLLSSKLYYQEINGALNWLKNDTPYLQNEPLLQYSYQDQNESSFLIAFDKGEIATALKKWLFLNPKAKTGSLE